VDEINSLGTTEGDIWSFTTSAYCTAAGTEGTTADYIKRVTLGDIDNVSGQGHYEDYTHISTDLNRGDEYVITVSLDYHWTADTVAVWIDWNQDGDFGTEEMIEMGILTGDHISTGTITVPWDAATGITRMRVRNIYNESPVPCGDFFGEVEDYSVNVTGFTSPPGYATLPVPFDGQQMVSTLAQLLWSPAEEALSHNIHFGMQSPPPFFTNSTDTLFDPVTLLENRTYYWRIDAVYAEGTAKGTEWSFTTFDSSVPNPLKIDFGVAGSPVEQGFAPYNAVNNTPTSFDTLMYGALGANIGVGISWLEGASDLASAVSDRGSDIITASPDLLRDWAGTDNRVSGNPLTITISDVPAGDYEWSSWHHDPLNQEGEFSVTVNDATGAAVTSSIMITTGNPAIGDVALFTAAIESSG
ncbi:MAG: GEVED domain-containing protein, partial [Bacteroidales bacterium]|nr:GEVED domain-containing protein [Bacteroidales bacterium]